jgi:hypothetical protein
MGDTHSKRNQSRAYVDSDGRLEDVLALIQLLGLAPEIQRSEKSLEGALLAPPQSAGTWMEIAGVHSELFRVYPSTGPDGPVASLVARRLQPADDRKLSPEFVGQLIQAAISIHETQLQRRQILKVAWVGGTLLALSAVGSVVSAVLPLLRR